MNREFSAKYRTDQSYRKSGEFPLTQHLDALTLENIATLPRNATSKEIPIKTAFNKN